MFETWNLHEFDRLPVVFSNLGTIKYKVFLKKDSAGRYWMVTYSVKQPAFRYVGKFLEKWNELLESRDIEAINNLLDSCGCYVSSYSGNGLNKVFESFTAWIRSPKGTDRLTGRAIYYCNIDDYLRNYTNDEEVIQNITDGLGVFCKDN